MNSTTILKLLTREYTLHLATTPADFEQVKRLRKKVFSEKLSIPEQTLESSGFIYSEEDKQSFLYLLYHNQTNTYVGTVRAFFVNTKTPIQQLPMQKDGHVNDIGHLTMELPIIEISRGALILDLPKHEIFSAIQLRTLLTYGLMIATRTNFLLYPYIRVFSMIEPSLHRILKRQNVNFEQVGISREYYGIRAPYAIERTKLLKETEENMGQITRHYLKELCENPEPFWEFIDNNPYLERSDIELERICKLFKEYGEDVDLSLLLGEEDALSPS